MAFLLYFISKEYIGALIISSYSKEQKDFLKEYYREYYLINFSRVFLLLFLLGLWQISSSLGWVDSFFFSSPLKIINLFWEMTREFTIWKHIGITLLETLVSFLGVTLISAFTAMGLYLSPPLAKILEPSLVVLNSLPKSALAPLIIVWLGSGIKTIIIAGISVALFGSIISLYTGFLQTDPGKIKLITTLGGSKKDVLFKLILPSCTPLILSNMKVNIGLSLVGVIIGEFLAARQGLGYLIIYSSQVFQLDLLIMSIVILCLIASLLYKTIQYFEKKYYG